MNLTLEQKSILLAWMRTKLYLQELIKRIGEEAALQEYLKDKSPKRLSYIIWALSKRFGKKFNSSNTPPHWSQWNKHHI